MTSDLTTYWNTVGVTQSLSNITFIQTTVGSMSAPTGEETLDTELASAFAPSGKVRVYGCLDLEYVDNDIEQIMTDMQSGVAITQVSMSFGGTVSDTGRSEIHTEHQYFATITAMGAALFASGGDSGVYGNAENHMMETLYPAADPDVTGVGANIAVFLFGHRGRPDRLELQRYVRQLCQRRGKRRRDQHRVRHAEIPERHRARDPNERFRTSPW